MGVFRINLSVCVGKRWPGVDVLWIDLRGLRMLRSRLLVG